MKTAKTKTKTNNVTKKKFTKDEDDLILDLVKKYGAHSWRTIAKKLSPRTPRQCRERWKHYLQKEPKSEEWTQEEDELLIQLFQKHGKKWTQIAVYIPGRTSVNIKNRYALLERHVKKKEKEKNNDFFQNFEKDDDMNSILEKVDLVNFDNDDDIMGI